MTVQEQHDVERRTKFARAPRRAVRVSAKQRLELVARLHADPRYLALKPRAKACLGYAVAEFADGEGKWWQKVERWAAAAGVSPATVKRAISEAAAVQLLTRTPYLRPDGFQGSTTYTLDPALVVSHLVGQTQGGSAVIHLNKRTTTTALRRRKPWSQRSLCVWRREKLLVKGPGINTSLAVKRTGKRNSSRRRRTTTHSGLRWRRSARRGVGRGRHNGPFSAAFFALGLRRASSLGDRRPFAHQRRGRYRGRSRRDEAPDRVRPHGERTESCARDSAAGAPPRT
jgi:hypothetical protein